jgi:hypothetical protein
MTAQGRQPIRRVLALAALGGMVLACSLITDVDGPLLTGHWIGTTDAGSPMLDLTLAEADGGNLSGSGTFTMAGEWYDVTAVGSYHHPTVEFELWDDTAFVWVSGSVARRDTLWLSAYVNYLPSGRIVQGAANVLLVRQED